MGHPDFAGLDNDQAIKEGLAGGLDLLATTLNRVQEIAPVIIALRDNPQAVDSTTMRRTVGALTVIGRDLGVCAFLLQQVELLRTQPPTGDKPTPSTFV